MARAWEPGRAQGRRGSKRVVVAALVAAVLASVGQFPAFWVLHHWSSSSGDKHRGQVAVRRFFGTGVPELATEQELDEIEESQRLQDQKLAAQEKDVSDFANLSSKEWLTGRVESIRDFGLLVEVTHPTLGSKATGLLHISSVIAGSAVSHTELKDKFSENQELQVRIRKVDTDKGTLKLTSIPLEEEEVEEPDPAVWDSVSPSEWLNGTVERAHSYGVFCKVTDPTGTQTVTGLVHISELGWSYVPDEKMQEYTSGQELPVRVLSVANGKVSLSARSEERPTSPEENLTGSLPPDKWVKATVVEDAPFGLFLQAEGVSCNGLLHNSQMSFESQKRRPQVGEELLVRRCGDNETTKVAFTEVGEVDYEALDVARTAGNTFQGIVAKNINVGHIVCADVNGVTVSGLLHAAEASSQKIKERDLVKVRLRTVDVSGRKVGWYLVPEKTDEARNDTESTEAPGTYRGLPANTVLKADVVYVQDTGVSVLVHHPEPGGPFADGIVKSKNIEDQALKKDLGKFFRPTQRVGVQILDFLDPPHMGAVLDLKLVSEETQTRALPASDQKRIVDLDDDTGFRGLAEGLDPEVLKFIKLYQDSLLDQGYDSVDLLRHLNNQEWNEMKEACKLKPGHAVQLRLGLARL